MDTQTDERRLRFEALVSLVYEPLQRYARRRCDAHTADDVVADVLLVLWRRLDDVPSDAVLPWCYRVGANCLANARRGDLRRSRLLDRVATTHEPERSEPAELPDPALHAALATLPDADQEVLRLWAWEDLTPPEIAQALDCTANAVSIRLHRAKRRLGAALGKTPGVDGHNHDDDRTEVT
ncbi:MAG TPA: sigma-70 family RNA polymerase sigma factor [Acidimicrobiia bacterium]|nr:sigma-70 family RNA polymerase sigma factor [Acidimicrobiia bacterium]